MKIYTSRLSPYGNRVYLWAAVKGVALEFVAPPGGTGSADYKKINPSGKIPALVAGELLVPESMVILDYLEDQFPAPSLRPEDAALRARTRAAVQIHDLYVMSELNPIFAQFARPATDEAAVERILDSVTQRLPLILSTLPPGDGYAAGAGLSLADCAMAPFFLLYQTVAANLRRANPIDSQPRLAQWSAALLRCPQFLPGLASMQQAFDGFLQRQGRTPLPVA